MRPPDGPRLAQLNNEDTSLWQASSDIVAPERIPIRSIGMRSSFIDFAHVRSENRIPPRINSGAGIFRDMRAENRGPAMSDEDLKDELERLRKENAALKKGASSPIRMKVSEKGAVSIYGMGRFPVTLYKEQWLKLLDMSADIRAFIAANEAQLKAKD